MIRSFEPRVFSEFGSRSSNSLNLLFSLVFPLFGVGKSNSHKWDIQSQSLLVPQPRAEWLTSLRPQLFLVFSCPNVEGSTEQRKLGLIFPTRLLPCK